MHTLARPAGLRLGLMLQPGNGYLGLVDQYDGFAADNGCFARGAHFDTAAWLAWLDTVPRAGCLFAVAPDVYGDAAATRLRSLPLLPRIRALGFPAAYVAQDGETPDTAPWGAFDVLFLGGMCTCPVCGVECDRRGRCPLCRRRGREWKLSATALALCSAARRRGVPVHMGRANSLRRLQAAQLMGCDSADGTYLKFAPDTNWPSVRRWLTVTQAQSPLFTCAGVPGALLNEEAQS